ncbi:hypothetical protein LTR50_007884 [Elasticomyces elasticus]|nr:hypothetical protein LTR50_007884 [Elasticomyces elasticus]
MSLSKALALALASSITLLLANANPLPDKVRRDPPAPSAYPIGTACPNEWQYLNFNPDDPTDQAHLQQLHEVVCGYDIVPLIISGIDAGSHVNGVYLRYFPNSDAEDDYVANVLSVYRKLYPQDSGTNLGPLAATFVIDNKDFDDNCADSNLAYTNTDSIDDREKIHFCDLAYTRPDIYHMQCSSFDPYPSTKLDSLSRIALHEMCHYSSVGPESSVASQIVDSQNDDGNGAYNPERCHGLVDPAQDDQPAKTEINADSYAWMAVDAYWSFACSTTPADSPGYFQDPPHYGDSDDEDDPL